MLMVIFGAGASYDSSPSSSHEEYPDLQERMPLAKDLFSNRPVFIDAISRFSRCQAIIPYLLPSKDKSWSIERELRKLQDEASDYPERYRQLAAIRYYLQFNLANCQENWQSKYLKGISNYKTLLDQIQRWSRGETVCLVSFNYDTLLEKALGESGVTINELQDYITNDRFQLIKPHGSINWAREIDYPPIDIRHNRVWEIAQEIIDKADEIRLSERYCISHNQPTCANGYSPLFPALSIPMDGKSEYECPKEHIETLCKKLPHVEKIVTIGWRATEKTFLQLLAEKLPTKLRSHVVVSGTSDAEQTISNLQIAGIRVEFTSSTQGFTRFVRDREIDHFLNQ